MTRLALGFVLLLVACRQDTLRPVPESIRVEPRQLDFGRVVVGSSVSSTVELTNAGKVALEGEWRLRGEGFRFEDGAPTRAELGSSLAVLRCTPEREGLFDGVLEIALAGFAPLSVPLACEGVAQPACLPSGPCRIATWSAADGRCVERAAEDGLSCASADACLASPTCRAGRCEGELRSCNDGDPCTADSCHPVRGCEHLAATECAGAGPCGVGRCAPGVGCVVEDAPDGTPCGPVRTCREADVCIAGACVRRDPPDGFECAPASPCAGGGRCIGDECQRPAPASLQPTWLIEPPQPDGGPPEAWSDLLTTRDGRLAVSSYFMTPPRLAVDTAAPVALPAGGVRRCVSWLDWLVCGDYPGSNAAPVSAVELTTGLAAWSYVDVARDVPEFVGPTVQFFTARLAVLNESELLALYESRTMTPEGADPRCRSFAMVVIDRTGQSRRSRFIADPIFSVCDHPHSYGVAVDAQSNIYLAFTPSQADNPARSLTGTTIFSYSPSLQLRWRTVVPGLGGGELIVADGLVFHERSATVYSAATGLAARGLSDPFGLGVVGEGVAVSKLPNGGVPPAFGWLGRVSTTTATFPPAINLPALAAETPLTLARWASPWGPREVVLAFTGGAQPLLNAFELATGAEAFSCPLALDSLPVMTAMQPGAMGLLVGPEPLSPAWPRCDDCDPRFARTRAGVATLPLPGVSPSLSDWAGAWGDEGHSHRERR